MWLKIWGMQNMTMGAADSLWMNSQHQNKQNPILKRQPNYGKEVTEL